MSNDRVEYDCEDNFDGPEESDWGVKMSNTPNLGPLESLKVAWKRLRGGGDDGE